MFEILFIIIAAFIGVAAQTIVGFGITFFAMPVLLVFINPPLAVNVVLLMGLSTSVLILLREKREHEVVWPVVLRLILAALPGFILGAYIVTRIDKAILQVAVGLLIIVSVLIQEFFFPRPISKLQVSRGINVTGLTAGFLNAAAAMAPAPLAIWFRTHKTTRNQIRHNLAVLFIIMNCFSLTAINLIEPQYGTELLKLFLFILPFIFLGVIVGKRISNRINTAYFHKIVFIAVLMAGLFSIGLGFFNLR